VTLGPEIGEIQVRNPRGATDLPWCERGTRRERLGEGFPVRRKTALFVERFRSFLAESGILRARVYIYA
jgi:hypothetical protein